jgi:hypothetical protein
VLPLFQTALVAEWYTGLCQGLTRLAAKSVRLLTEGVSGLIQQAIGVTAVCPYLRPCVRTAIGSTFRVQGIDQSGTKPESPNK